MLGSKFRSHMVLGALLLSLGPVIFCSCSPTDCMNRSIEKWFSRPAEDVQYRTNVIASLLTEYAPANAQDEAQRIAASPDAQKSFHTGNFTFIMDEFRRSEVTLQGGFAFALVDDRAEASFHAPESWPLLRRKLPTKPQLPGQPKPFDIARPNLRSGPGSRRRSWTDPGRHAVAGELLRHAARCGTQPAAISGSAAAAPAVAPHLSRLAAAADGGRAVRLDLAGALSLEDGDPPAGRAGRSDARNFARTISIIAWMCRPAAKSASWWSRSTAWPRDLEASRGSIELRATNSPT